MTTVLIESDPEVRELVEHMTRVLGLPRFMKNFSVHFRAGEPIIVETAYIATRESEPKEKVPSNVH